MHMHDHIGLYIERNRAFVDDVNLIIITKLNLSRDILFKLYKHVFILNHVIGKTIIQIQNLIINNFKFVVSQK